MQIKNCQTAGFFVLKEKQNRLKSKIRFLIFLKMSINCLIGERFEQKDLLNNGSFREKKNQSH